MINTLSSNLEKSVLVTTKPNAFFEIKLTRDISQQPKKNKKKLIRDIMENIIGLQLLVIL